MDAFLNVAHVDVSNTHAAHCDILQDMLIVNGVPAFTFCLGFASDKEHCPFAS